MDILLRWREFRRCRLALSITFHSPIADWRVLDDRTWQKRQSWASCAAYKTGDKDMLGFLTRLAIVAMALAGGAAHLAQASGSKLIDFRLEYVWRIAYSLAPGAKAMAIAENGAYGFAYGNSSITDAGTLALSVCTEKSKYLGLRSGITPPCRILASQNAWKADDLTADPDWQKPVSGKDKPMLKGRKYTLSKGQSRGAILLVHGCNGLGDKVFTDVWGQYFNALGYDFYAPDSFAVERPKEVCGNTNDYPADQVSTVWRLRVAQTQRTLADLKSKNPGKPVYMWGHSEGGLIVQMIETDLAGVIVSGEECGVLGTPVALASAVPLLYIWGEYDQYVNGVGYRITQDSTKKCAQDFSSHKPRFAILEGRSHIPWPWNGKVNSAVANFVQAVKPVEVALLPANKKVKSLWKRTKPDNRYRKSAPHRAAAINRSGTSYMVWGLDNEEDARQLALFGCDRNTSRKTNVFKTGKHLCSVVDLNGSAPK
jgi:Alpha/beta hydrolase family